MREYGALSSLYHATVEARYRRSNGVRDLDDPDYSD